VGLRDEREATLGISRRRTRVGIIDEELPEKTRSEKTRATVRQLKKQLNGAEARASTYNFLECSVMPNE
jgi:hypothetical protein